MDFRDKANKDEKSTTCNCIHSHVKSRKIIPMPQLYRKSRVSSYSKLALATWTWYWAQIVQIIRRFLKKSNK